MQIPAVTLNNINYNSLQKTYFKKHKESQISFRATPYIDTSHMAIKQAYNAKNINYLLPNQIWSDDRILKTVENFNNVIEKLFSENRMKPKYLQREVGKILPNYVHGRIKVRDFSELPEKEQKRACALTSTNPQGSDIYVKFLPKEHSRKDEILLKEAIGHELTHALNAQLKNSTNKEFYERKFSPRTLSEMFIDFTTEFFLKGKFSSSEEIIDNPNHESLLKRMGFDSVEDMYTVLNDKVSKLEETLLLVNCIFLNPEKRKDFYTLLAKQAKDEKMAYQTSKVLRELTAGKPVALELRSVFFEEAENFFNKKANGDFELSEKEEMELLVDKLMEALGEKDKNNF